jgi:KaiC/GvpD/RAD55 family RecA-like ATPase
MSALPGDLPRSIREIDESADIDLSRMNRARLSLRGDADADPAPLRAVEVGDLKTATITPPKFVVDSIAPRGHVTLLGGHGGSGKSLLALAIAAHVAAGTAWASLKTAQGRVWFVSLEDPAELVRWRLRAICADYGLDRFAVARSLVIFDGTESDACALASEVFADGRTILEPSASLRQLREAAAGVALIVIDNASDAFDGNENDRRQVRTFVRLLAKVARDNDAAVILLAHIDKQAARYGSQGNSYSGSTAWHNSARSRLALVDSDGAIELRHEKANLCRKIDPIRLRFNDKGVMIPADASAAHGADDMLLLHCLHAAILRGDIIGTARVGAGTALAHARTLPHFPDGLKSSPRFWGALGRLEASGAIVREEYTNANRKVRQRWAIAPNAPNTGLAQ